MSFFALVAALLLEQLRPLPVNRLVHAPLSQLARFLEARCNAGEFRHGALAWVLAVLPALLLVTAVYYLLHAITPLLGWGWAVAVLYLTMGFRQFSHHFTEIHLALRVGDIATARRLLAAWQGPRLGVDVERLSSADVARLSIEGALTASHRHVYAVLLWFVVLGPAGAVLYRMAAFLAEAWGGEREDFGAFGKFPQQIFAIVDWLPVRLTALAFAIVGDFEDAAYCWRTQAEQWPQAALGIVLASGAGALGVRLGMPLSDGLSVVDRPELGLGDDADADFMQSAVGLVWRALVLWLLLLLLLGLAGWLGV